MLATAISFQPLLLQLLQVPDAVSDIFDKLLEVPLILRVVTVCLLIALGLGFLEKQFKVLDSLIGTLQSIRAKLAGTPEAAVDTQADRDKLLKAFKRKTLERLKDVLSDEQLIALSWEDRYEEVGRYHRQTAALSAPPTVANEKPSAPFLTTLSNLNPIRLLTRPGKPEQPPVPIEPNARMMDVFNRGDVAGRLLILGEPGAGKTTTLLELAKELITAAEAEPTAPVPIIFELSAWTNDKQPIADWLVVRLKDEYNVPIKTGQHWVETHQILPLLDGLDELGMARQKLCAAKINDFLPEGEPDRKVVVCCRTKEFKQGDVPLTGLNGAVELQPLSERQIRGYLKDVGQPGLWETIEQSGELRELAPKPLMLTLMAVALVNRQAQTTKELFEAYIDERFKRYKADHDGELPYSQKQTLHYLKRLANQLKDQNQTAFLIEGMQPEDWLVDGVQKWAYRLIVGLILGLIVGLIFGLILSLILGLIVGLIFSLISGLDNIALFESFDFSFSRETRKQFFKELFQYLIGGLIGGLILGLIVGLIFGLIFGLIGGLIVGLILGLIKGLKSDITIRTQPNQGIIASAKNSVITALLGLALSGVLYLGLSDLLPLLLTDAELVNSIIGASVAVTILISLNESGGQACIQHFALRLVLWRSNAIPRNYAHFLRYTSALRLTRQTGGEFRFFHDLLREHIAHLP